MIKRSIEELIIKYCTNQINADEIQVLNNWLNEKESNQLIFKQYVEINYDVSKCASLVSNRLNVSWDVIQKEIKPAKRKTLYWKYAVAASIVLFISISVIFINNNKAVSSTTITTAPPVIINNDIAIGSNKAVLTLDDGSDIILEKGKKLIANNLKTNGEALVYTSAKVSKTEIKYNYLTIPRGGQFSLILPDGTTVWLNSESQIKYPNAFAEGEPRKVELLYGEAFFEVSPSTNHNGAKFIVGTQLQEIEVLGTAFNIKAYKDEANIYTTLAEGIVSVNNGLAKATLKPGEQSTVDTTNQNNDISITEVDVKRITSWKNGIFSFKNESLKDIAKVLTRWYDVDIIFIDKALEDIRFNGVSSKNQNIEEILLNIKHTNFINSYKINGKTIIIK